MSVRTRFIRPSLAVLALTGAIGLATPSVAVAIPTGGSTAGEITMKELKASGYSCGRAGVGGWLCTKSNSPTYACDNLGDCVHVGTFERPPRGTTRPPGPSPRAEQTP